MLTAERVQDPSKGSRSHTAVHSEVYADESPAAGRFPPDADTEIE